jgi:pyridoxal phosphate enzyme (YggS family)
MSTEATIAERLEATRQSVAEAARAAGRQPGEVRLIAVSKSVGVAAIEQAARAGQCDFGENYVQDAMAKIAGLESYELRWHMIGQLQSNKAAKVARTFHLVHSLASLSAARAISRAMVADGSTCRLLLQIRLGGPTGRGGVSDDDAPGIARSVAAMPGIRLEGVMGVAPQGVDARPHFARLRSVLETLRGLGLPNAPLTELSAGMTDDFREAILEGATIVRIGRAIFGPRSPERHAAADRGDR